MAAHSVKLIATEGIFRGLAQQNILFHQCVGELIDNSIAAQKPNQKFRVDIIFIKHTNESENLDLYVLDNCKGMDLETFKKALQLGECATEEHRLNEHGFGLKNALATLSGGNGYWKIWTRTGNSSRICSVEGPFGPRMTIEDEDSFPDEDFLTSVDISTIIKVPVKMSLIQTVQGRGAPSTDLQRLREWLIEHLGVLYRGYLEQDKNTYETTGTITLCIGNDSIRVPPVPIPLGNKKIEYIDVELSGNIYKLEYNYGTLDVVKRDTLVRGNRAKFYYQGNIPTQGIDIRLGKRVIATREFESIWKTEEGDSQLSRHNSYNDFLGELLIEDVPRGVLTTTNNKTDFNLDDPDWVKIFQKLNEIRPTKDIREKTEKGLKTKWMRMLKATNPDDQISDEISVWPTGTKIDVYRKIKDKDIIVYEIKTGTGSPIHLYQLKMYWDGLVLEGEQPKEGVLLVEDFSTNLEEMVNRMNKLPPPQGSKPYNLKLAKHADKGL
jgi:hypothetical protein